MMHEGRSGTRWIFLSVAAVAGLGVIGIVVRSWQRSSPLPPSRTSQTSPDPAGSAHFVPKGRATVSVYDEGAPLPDRWVVFHDASGSVIASAKSGADGKVSSDIPADAMITVAHGTSIRHLITVAGVQPGDDVVVGERDEDESVAKVAGTAHVKLPGKLPDAIRYTVSLGVGATEVPSADVAISMSVLERFLDKKNGKRFRILGEAFDASGEPLGFAFAWGALGKDATDVRLSPWSKDWRSTEIVLSNAPTELTSVEGKLGIISQDEDRFGRKPRRADLHDGKAALRFAVPPQIGNEAEYELDFAYGSSPDKAHLLRHEESMPPLVAVDVRAAVLPRVSAAAVEPSDVLARSFVRWTVSGDAARADASVVCVRWPDTREHVWTIVLSPKAPTRFRLPALPAALAGWAPDGRPTTAAVGLVDASFFDGFDDVRHKGIQMLKEPPEDDARMVSTSTTGDVEF